MNSKEIHTPEQVREATEVADAICITINRLAEERGKAYDGLILFSALASVLGWTLVGCPPDMREELLDQLIPTARQSLKDGEKTAREHGITIPRMS